MEKVVSDVAILLKCNILHGLISETNKDIQVKFDIVFH